MSANSRKRTSPKRKTARASVERSRIGNALGASRTFKVAAKGHGPFGVAALAREVQERLVSTGGRPSDAVPTIRRLVPIRKAVWNDLQRRAERVSGWGRRVSPAQLAAILVEKGLQDMDASERSQDRANSA